MTQQALFAAGCFWCIEEIFRATPGVIDTAVGYSGGECDNPTYEAVCSGKTGHAEVTLVTFDPTRISYETLLELFWDMHDPTTLNRQGPDVGSQYRSAIFFMNESQRESAQLSKDIQEASGRHGAPLVTEITPATRFWPAEEYHQQYYCKRRGEG